MILDLAAEGNYVACRPSGTEPKIKFYMFTYTPPEQFANIDQAKAQFKRATRSRGSGSEKVCGRVMWSQLKSAIFSCGSPGLLSICQFSVPGPTT